MKTKKTTTGVSGSGQGSAVSRSDVQQQSVSVNQSPINWVGMRSIDVPVRLEISGVSHTLMSKCDVFVSLDKADQRGIHMSRSYRIINEVFEKGIPASDQMENWLKKLAESQEGISNSARIEMSFEVPMKRESLTSGLQGWRSYPVKFIAEWKNSEILFGLASEVEYSSTCPCSAGLSRELNVEAFQKKFPDQFQFSKAEMESWLASRESIAGTPHAQRSRAQFKIELKQFSDLIQVLTEKIDGLEKVLATPVQTLVKKDDEKEFARLNAANLMFCEDAARRVKAYLSSAGTPFHCEVRHEESLHPHDAVAVVSSGDLRLF